MSQVQGFKLSVEEYASEAAWIEKLLRPLNNFAQSTMNAVNGGLVLSDNVIATYKRIRAQVPALVWNPLTPENSTQTSGEPTLGYYVAPNGTVYIRGAVAPTTKVDGTVMWTLPSTLYPETTQTVVLNHDHGSSHAYATLSASDGKLRIYNLSASANNVFFNGLTFFAATPPSPKAYVGNDWPIKLSTEFELTVGGVLLMQATDVDTNETLSTSVGNLDWVATARNEVTVKSVTGLTPKRTYDLTFLIVGV